MFPMDISSARQTASGVRGARPVTRIAAARGGAGNAISPWAGAARLVLITQLLTLLVLAAGMLAPEVHAANSPGAQPPEQVQGQPPQQPSTAPAPSTELGTPHRPRIGVVLSGGGARGAAHIGVLKVLEQMHVPIDAIAGTSMGAVVGGLYGSGLSAHEF